MNQIKSKNIKCNRCSIIKPIEDFRQGYRKDRKEFYIANYCRPCESQYIMEWRNKKIKKMPWMRHYNSAYTRCKNPRNLRDRNIKFLMSPEDFKNQLLPFDVRMSLLKVLLFHSYSHVNQSLTSGELPETIIPFRDGRFFIINSYSDGFDLTGTLGNGDRRVVIDGFDEAMTQLAGIETSRLIGTPDISLDPTYEYGKAMIGRILTAANITDLSEFMEYYQGRKSLIELIERLRPLTQPGTPEIQRIMVIQALTYIGYVIDGSPLSLEETTGLVQSLLPAVDFTNLQY